MARIVCGNCKGIHGSVAEVRNCYSVKAAPAVMALHTIRGDVEVPALSTAPAKLDPKPATAATVTETFNGATEKQISFIQKLGEDRDIANLAGRRIKVEGLEYLADRLYTNAALEGGLVSKKAASALIDTMLDLPFVKREVPADEKFEFVPDGRYAIDNASGKGIVFYKVWTRRNGSRGVDLQISDDYVPVRRSDIAGILNRIGKDVRGAFARYGQEIGACGVCGRTLTDETSREIGIGPICRNKI